MTGLDGLDRVRAAYDTVAASYSAMIDDVLAVRPLDRAVIGAFAELVPPGLPVVDAGCGPGHLTLHLHSLGLAASGFDLSPGMVEQARERAPGLRFGVAPLDALPVPDGALGGLLVSYSLIHTPPERVPAAIAEFHRVLAPAGSVLLGFQIGEGPRHIAQGYGHPMAIDAHLFRPEWMSARLADAGFEVFARLLREPVAPERHQQAYLLARKTGVSPAGSA